MIGWKKNVKKWTFSSSNERDPHKICDKKLEYEYYNQTSRSTNGNCAIIWHLNDKCGEKKVVYMQTFQMATATITNGMLPVS